VPAKKKSGFFASTRASADAPAPLRPGTRPLSDYALANRLSYFLWSSMPDAELLAHAAAVICTAGRARGAGAAHGEGRPHPPPRGRIRRRLARFRRFEEINTVDRDRFPEFNNELRSAMFEEPIHFFTDLAREDRSVLNFSTATTRSSTAPLAKHYCMTGVHAAPDEWCASSTRASSIVAA